MADIVNPVDAFFDDYNAAVESDRARRPSPRPMERRAPAPVPQAAPVASPAPATASAPVATKPQAAQPVPAQSAPATPARPHVQAFEKRVAPAPAAPTFIKAEKAPSNPKLQGFLANKTGEELEKMGQEFATKHASGSPSNQYNDGELQQVYSGLQESLREKVKGGYKLKTMDETKLFEDD